MAVARGGRMATIAMVALLAAVVTGCGSNEPAADTSSGDDRPTVVATTNILGDVVRELVGDQAEVVTIMPVGVDPHDFQPSAQEVDRLLSADALIVNGAGFEESLIDVIDAARGEGVPTFEATDAVETIEYADDGHGHDNDDDDQSGDDDRRNVDPHFFTDPARMAEAVRGVAAFLRSEVDGLDEAALNAAVESYLDDLDALDSEVEDLVATIPEQRRILVTSHEVFGYFADRYGFEVVGVVVPGGTTAGSAGAGELAELALLIEAEQVPAIFVDTSSATQLAATLAGEVDDVALVELYTESLGEPGSDGATYVDMVRTNASRISAALS